MTVLYWLRENYTARMKRSRRFRQELTELLLLLLIYSPYGNYRLEESKAPEGYLTDGAKAIDFSITEDGKNRGLDRQIPLCLQPD